MKPKMRTGQWLAAARSCAGLTQTELARLAGLKSTIGISLYETGAQSPSSQTWDALEEALRRRVPLMFVDEEALISAAAAGVEWQGKDALCRLSYASSRHGVAFTGVEAVRDGQGDLDGPFITVSISEALRLLTEQKAWFEAFAENAESAPDDDGGAKREGAELREMRKALGISQRDVSLRISIPQPVISLLERGVGRNPGALKRYREFLEHQGQGESSINS